MNVAWTLQVTAGVTVSSFAMLPSRASAESRGVSGPRCRGVNPTTIMASTGFKIPLLGDKKQPAVIRSSLATTRRLVKVAIKVAPCPVKLAQSHFAGGSLVR